MLLFYGLFILFHVASSTIRVPFTNSTECTRGSQTKVCFYEYAHYQGGCACIASSSTNGNTVVADNDEYFIGTGPVGSIRFPTRKTHRVIVNSFQDDFVREIVSYDKDICSARDISEFDYIMTNVVTISKRDSICVFQGLGYANNKSCFALTSADYGTKQLNNLDFIGIIFYPTNSSNVYVNVNGSDIYESKSSITDLFTHYTSLTLYGK